MIVKVKIDTEQIEGEIELDIPKYLERIELLKSVSVKDEQEVDSIEQARKLFELAAKNTKSVNLKHKKSNTAFSSIDELEMYSDGIGVIYSIGSYVINGIPLGNG